MGKNAIAIYGAGGFAREIAWLLSTHANRNQYDMVGYIEDDLAEPKTLNGKPVFSWQDFVASKPQAREVLMTVAIGNPQARSAIVWKCREAGFEFPRLVHGSVEMSEFVELGPGTIVCGGSILTVNIRVEQQVHINLDCTIGHDVRIGEFATLSPGVHVSGNVHIGRYVYIGTGATIINGTSREPLIVADGTVVAAGACITRSTEPHSLYAGVPAELKKRYK